MDVEDCLEIVTLEMKVMIIPDRRKKERCILTRSTPKIFVFGDEYALVEMIPSCSDRKNIEAKDEEGSEEEPVETGPGPWDLNYSRPPTIAHLLN